MPRIMKMPKIGVNMTDAVIVGWLVKEGDTIKEGDVILEAETDKALQDIEATESGIIGKILVKEGEKVLCQHPIAVLLDEGESLEDDYIRDLLKTGSSDQTQDNAELESQDKQDRDIKIETKDKLPEDDGRIKISPLAKRLARELGIDYRMIKPKGEGKSITKEDVLAFAQERKESQVQDKERLGQDMEADEYIPFTGTRKIIADKMCQSTAIKPSAALTLEADADMLVKWRNRLKLEGKPVSYDALLTYIVSRALKKYPYINSRLDGEKIVLIKDINIGVAVDSQRGLVVPVIKNADKMGILEISDALSSMVDEIKKGKVSVQYLEGGTFTITNLGMFEVEQFTPIINPPECCILAVGAIVRKPVVLKETDTVAIAHRMQLTLVFDHRMVDGAPAARFLQRVKHLIEFPFQI
ncbi:MAG: dihydrolipoamide acetyltransferase family protein [Mahellales bacterium]